MMASSSKDNGPTMRRFADMQYLCRVCAQENAPMREIFGPDCEKEQLADQINKFLPISVALGDSLPQQICSKCRDVILNIQKLCDVAAASNDLFCTSRDEDTNEENIFTDHKRKKRSTQHPDAVKRHKKSVLNILELDLNVNENWNEIPIFDPVKSSFIIEHKMPGQNISPDYIEVHVTPSIDTENTSENIIEDHFRLKDDIKLEKIDTGTLLDELTGEGEIFDGHEAMTDGDVTISLLSCKQQLFEEPLLPIDTHKLITEPLTVKHTRKLPFPCEYCNYKVHQNAQSHYVRHNVAICRYCFLVFANEKSLDEHVDSMHGYTCDRCMKTVYGRGPGCMYHHMKVHHGKKKVVFGVVCELCSGTFQTKASLRKHMLDLHNQRMCIVCRAFFATLNELNDHKKTEDHDFSCESCSIEFKNKLSLARHAEKVHNVVQSEKQKTDYICKICENTKFTHLNLLKVHYKLKHSMLYCTPCGEVFSSLPEIDLHSLQEHGKISSWRYQCVVCNSYFDTVAFLERHVRSVHGTKNLPCLCDECGQAFKRKHNLKCHIANKHNGVPVGYKHCKCDFCGLITSKKYLYIHMKIHVQLRDVACPKCDKRFVCRSNMLSHLRGLHKVGRTLCPHCYKYIDDAKMDAHYKEMHESEWSFRCNLCLETFPDESLAASHISNHGPQSSLALFEKISPYRCDRCGNYFANKRKLDTHFKRLHLRENNNKLLYCDICEEKITNRLNHLYKVHDIPYPFKCSQCPKSFRYKASYDNHQKYHQVSRPYHCDECISSFTKHKHLRTHQKRVHTERKHKCPHCSFAFKDKHALNKHLFLHTGIFLYQCDKCGHEFKQKGLYQRHMNRHSANLPILESNRLYRVQPVDGIVEIVQTEVE